MGIEKIPVEQFVQLSQIHTVIDVRSDAEYAHAHIPGASSIPLFNDEERAIVGTIYKQQSREDAIKKGLEFFGPKMKAMLLEAERLIQENNPNNKTVNTQLITIWSEPNPTGKNWIKGANKNTPGAANSAIPIKLGFWNFKSKNQLRTPKNTGIIKNAAPFKNTNTSTLTTSHKKSGAANRFTTLLCFEK